MKMTLKNLFKLLGLDKVDWKKATTRLLAILWLVLGICFVLKMFGGNWFGIYTHNQAFINMCNAIEQSPILIKVYPFPFYLLSCYLAVLTISRDKPKKNHWIFIIIIGLIYLAKVFNEYIGLIIEIIILYLLYSIKVSGKIWRGIETYIIMFLFQIVSLITKNIGYKLDYDNLVISSIYMIDCYIMMTIYCVNTIIRKESLIMGLFGPILLSKKGDQLVAYRNKLVEKKAKLDARIKDIDRAIENEKIENK